jgi:pullulanase/glycogen debranching enzyme
VLYNTPEGSYASDPNGTARQTEFKSMVLAFHQHHIGVVLDVVFNQTVKAGFWPFSIFDKIFPRYYYSKSHLAYTPTAPVVGMKSPQIGPWRGNSSWINVSLRSC